MDLKTQPNLDKVLQRFEAWWNCQIVDRPPVSLWVKSDKPARPLPAKTWPTTRDRWFDIDYILDRVEAQVEASVHLADTFPCFYQNLGPEITATVFGCDLNFGEYTSWSKPVAHSCRDILKIKPNLDNPYWNWIRKATDLSLQRGKGKWITGLPDLHTNGDLPAALRDPQELCIDLAEDIDSVRAAVDYCNESFQMIYDDIWKKTSAAGMPSTTWTATLHQGRSYVTSCDFICMISNDMFRRTILPALVGEMEFLERNIFHLDGPGALRHLDALLEQPRLNGIQWVYGDGKGPAAKWIDVYKRVQAAGKNIQLLAADLNDAMTVAEHLKPEGVWFCIGGAFEPEQAKAALDTISAWAAGKKA